MGLLAITGIPEVILSEAQNHELAKATQRVARHFPTILTEKQQDIAGLALCLGAISFAQFSAYNARIAAEHRQREQRQGPIIDN